MNKKAKNNRRSQWRVVNRCMNILLRLLRGSAKSEELLEFIYQDARDDNERLDDKVAKKRFEEDRLRLREWFWIELDYDRANNQYKLIDICRPLIDIPEDAVTSFAFLQKTFSEDNVPMVDEVRVLLQTISMLLPTERRKAIEKERGLLEVNLGARDEDVIQEDVWQAIKTSVSERRHLEFDYFSASSSDGLPRTHRVEPIRYFFDPVWKHYYLECFWLESRSHHGTFDQHRKVERFRLGRMKDARVLPNHFPPMRIPKKEIIYELTPLVARLGVTRHFPDMQIETFEDGSAKVRVMSRNLFFDLRTLLHYGDNCRVVGGEEAVRQMRQIVMSLSSLYTDNV